MNSSAILSPLASGRQQSSRSHGEFLRMWEAKAPLSEAEFDLCAQVEQGVSHLNWMIGSDRMDDLTNDNHDLADVDPKANAFTALLVPDQKESNASTLTSKSGSEMRHPPVQVSFDTDLAGLQLIRSTEEFREWYENIERKLDEANEAKYRQMIYSLCQDKEKMMSMLNTVEDCVQKLEQIQIIRLSVLDTTVRFKSECESLVSERKRFSELADALRKRLKYFEELETLSLKFSSGKDAISPTHPDFVRILHRLDECVAYASSSTGAVAEADGYLARFLELQRRAFTMIRDYTVGTLRATTNAIIQELRQENKDPKITRDLELNDASREYLKFRAIAPKVKGLIAELSSRAQADVSKSIKDIMGGADVNAVRILSNPLFSSRNIAVSLLIECEEVFVEQRRRVLEPAISAHIMSLGDIQSPVGLARSGSAYMIQICELEKYLFESFFLIDSVHEGGRFAELSSQPSTSSALSYGKKKKSLQGTSSSTSSGTTKDSGLASHTSSCLFQALRSLCELLYDEIRPRLLKENDLDKLAYLIEVLRMEILADEIPRSGLAGEALSVSIYRCIADAQERIIYRAEIYLRDEIKGFVATPADLDYPNILLSGSKNDQGGPGASGELGRLDSEPSTPGMSASSGLPHASGSSTPANSNKPRKKRGHFRTWYPPVEYTLRLLSMLYRCVDSEVFGGIAQEAVMSCVQAIATATRMIAARKDEYADEHAQFFFIWQLLMLREQISPFDVEFAYTEKELDFFELRQLLGHVVRGHVSFKSLAQPPPATKERVVDSKRSLERELRAACESFILSKTRLLIDPILAFLAKCNTLPLGAEQRKLIDTGDGMDKERSMNPVNDVSLVLDGSSNAKDDVRSSQRTLGSASPQSVAMEGLSSAPQTFETLKANPSSFVHPDQLRALWKQVRENVSKKLVPVVQRMNIYISKPSTKAVLLRPLHANCAEACRELISILQSRYTLEEREQIGINGEEISKLLDELEALITSQALSGGNANGLDVLNLEPSLGSALSLDKVRILNTASAPDSSPGSGKASASLKDILAEETSAQPPAPQVP